MKFTVNIYDFKNSFEKAMKVVAKKSSAEILENVKIEIEENKCYLYATDLVNYVKIYVNKCNISDENGSFVFRESKSLLKALKFFKDGDIQFETIDNKVKISCGGKKAEQLIFKSDEFPEFPKVEAKNSYKYTVDKLKNRFKSVNYAVSKSDSKPIFQGICFKDNGIIACNGFRLAINKDDNLNIDTPFIVNADTIKTFCDIGSDNIDINISNNHMLISNKDITFISRLLDGEYLDVDRVIPQNNTYKVKVNKDKYMESLKYLKVFCNSKDILAVWNNNNLSTANDSGKYESDIDMIGEFDFKIGFNIDYMLEALGQCESDNIIIEMNGALHPISISDNENFALLLPVRMKE